MNQNLSGGDRTRGQPARHPTRQRCLTPSLSSQLLQDTAMPPRCAELAARRPGKERRRPGPWVQERGRGGPGGRRRAVVKARVEARGRRGASPGGVCAPGEPGLPGAAAPAPDAAGLRGPLGGPGPGPAPSALPPPPPGPFVWGEPVVWLLLLRVSGPGAGGGPQPSLPSSERQDAEKDFHAGTWPAFSCTHTYFFLTGRFPKKFNSKSLGSDMKAGNSLLCTNVPLLLPTLSSSHLKPPSTLLFFVLHPCSDPHWCKAFQKILNWKKKDQRMDG